MQHIYSQAIIDFVIKARGFAKQILQFEMLLPVFKSRFAVGEYRYPLHIVVFEGADMLGYFNAELFEIGLNKHFICHGEHLMNTLRHELAHYLCWIKYGDLHHSPQFRELCKSFGWGEAVYGAKTFVDKPTSSKMESKIKKLLALSGSTNPHEAQSALVKANQYLLTHQSIPADLAVRRVLSGKKSSPKWHAIADILRTFGVRPVFNRGQGRSYLEVFGPPSNIATAEYIAIFLDREFENLWKAHGTGLRSAFFEGIAKGYLKKIKPVQKPFKPGLIALENALEDNLWMPYPHLQQTTRSRKTCANSLKAGMKAGQKLTIRSPVESERRRLYLENN